MRLVLELDGEVPIYQQLRDQIVEAIADGTLCTGEALPRTRHLATDLGINMHTVNKAYELLRQEGLVRLGRRTGAVVSRDATSGPPDAEVVGRWTGRARTLFAEALAKGMPPLEVVQLCQSIVVGFGTS
jgi:DNA-binding transcriptional regulator YhcF (GntR family)